MSERLVLLKRECAGGLLQFVTVTSSSSMPRAVPGCKVSVCAVHECVHSSKRWMQIAMTTNDFFF